MQWRTHLVLGISSLWLLAPLPGVLSLDSAGILAASASLGALLPDLDAAQSKIRSISLMGTQPFVPISSVIHRSFGHRGFMHSLSGLWVVAAMSLVLLPWTGILPLMALWLGYASHLAGDALTPSGVPVLYPIKHRWHLLPYKLRVVTGSVWEEMVFAIAAALTLYLLLLVLFQTRS